MSTQAGAWQYTFRSPAAMARILDALVAAMTAEGYPEGDVFAVRLALSEAIGNAVRHGNRGDPAKAVRIRYHVTPRQVLAEVEDEGPGFDPGQVPDPRGSENRERGGGRGLLLMRQYLTWVRHNERGNCVMLCKCRSPG